jgi:hypothetical protein
MTRSIIALILVAAGGLHSPVCHAQDSLERGLLRQAPKLIDYFKQKGYRNVGVLKFLVSREGGGFTDNVGTLNLLAARRLELALILANDPRMPVGILENASEVANKIKGVSHLSKEGREKLFTGRYPLAWGKDSEQPDAFATGTAEISKDLRRLTISLYCFDRTINKLVPVGEDFQVANAPERLTEIGESFVLRGVFDKGNVEIVPGKQEEKTYQYAVKEREEKVYQQAVKVREQEYKHPARQADAPVSLEIRYDGKPVPLEFKDGKAYVPEPNEGQTVTLGLRRDGDKERYGVVLKVNGENTMDRQRLPDLSCRKWILDPGYGPWTIEGFQIGDKVREKFRVASVAESKQREVYYGHDVGTITMTVFREWKMQTRPKLEDDYEQHQQVIKKMPELSERPKNYQALKAQLLDDANRGESRGLILPGGRENSEIEVAAFTADPTPIMSLTIVYYRR